MWQGRKKRSLALFGAALLCVVLLFVGQLGSDYPRSYYYFWDLGHLFCFALWTYFYITWRPSERFGLQCLQVVLLTVLIGGATELIQAGLGRTASWPAATPLFG